MKRFVFLAKITLLILLLAGSVVAAITIEGETVHVETDNYIVQFNKGVIEYIHNKLTDETYTHPAPRGKNGWSGLLFNRYFWDRENVATQRATLVSATQLSADAVELLYRQEGTDVLLAIAVDPMTDDLLIDMEGMSGTPGVVGMQWGLGYLNIQNLSVIAPIDGGRITDASTPKNYAGYFYPGGWEAQLAVVQGELGGFYIRNTDNTLQFKTFIYDRADDGVALNFGTYNQAPFGSHTTAQSQMWRFNTYAGNWRVPARIYRDWMEQAFQPRRLSNMPSWVEDISLFFQGVKVNDRYSLATLDKLAKLVDPTKTLIMLGEWATGRGNWWNDDLIVHYPEYEPKPGLAEFLEVAHEYGFRVILYADLISFAVEHPLYPQFIQYQYRHTWTGELLGWMWEDLNHPHRHASINPASSQFRKILVEELKAVWEAYDIDGFFMDASHYVVNDANGLIDGLTSAQGAALLHKELIDAMPGIVLGGERLHEATFARESFAQRPLIVEQKSTPHPISAFLFSPFVHSIGMGRNVPHLDIEFYLLELEYHEIWDVMPTLGIWGPGHLEEQFIQVREILARTWNWQHKSGLHADINSDGQVDILDLTLVAQNVGVTAAHPEADVNGDGLVNVLDLIVVANMFEKQ